MVIEPTIDHRARVGSHSSDFGREEQHPLAAGHDRDRLHLRRAHRRPERRKWEVDNIDPHSAEKIAGGRLRVRKLALEEALKKYGNDSHH